MSFRKLGYVLAQAVILALWAQDWRSGVGGVYPERILLPEALTISLLGMPPALVIGVIDGRSSGWKEGPGERIGLAVLVTLLVLGLAVWLSAAGLLSLHANFDFGGTREPPALVRVFVLFVVETIFAAEVVTAFLTSRYVKRSR